MTVYTCAMKESDDCAEELADGEASASHRDLTPDFYQDPALTLASLLRMMSRFPSRCSPALANSISAHLQMLVADSRQHPEIRLCASELMQSWAHTADLLTPDSDAASGTHH